jgi:dienelactone hydrolase
VEILAGSARLAGDLDIPPGAQGVVLFAHGSGSGRFSPRNRAVAETLQRAGLGTLLMDLLTVDEEREDVRTGRLRFDIELLSERVVAAVDRLTADPETNQLHLGCFGASTGAAAALIAAAEQPQAVRAVVCRGGRPDLAANHLPAVRAPTLLIVGGRDEQVIRMNQEAMALLRSECRLEIVPGATHLFVEPGALEEVARLASEWFQRFLA